ncbi:MAG: (Fe-S)-binding protein [Methanobacteriota archaeon]
MKRLFAPGCALLIYKPALAKKVHELLCKNLGDMEMLDLCCMNEPEIEPGAQVINVCPGCDKRYREREGSSTISLWEVLSASDSFDFPDYGGNTVSIIDACPTRTEVRVHRAVRTLLGRMNIVLVEPKNSGLKSTCCGDSGWGKIPVEAVKEIMRKRASEMPVEDVVVYCVSCAKSVFIGGKKPRYLVDLLFGEDTIKKTFEPDEWHKELDEFTATHRTVWRSTPLGESHFRPPRRK